MQCLRLALRLELVEVRENGVELLGDGGLAGRRVRRAQPGLGVLAPHRLLGVVGDALAQERATRLHPQEK